MLLFIVAALVLMDGDWLGRLISVVVLLFGNSR